MAMISNDLRCQSWPRLSFYDCRWYPASQFCSYQFWLLIPVPMVVANKARNAPSARSGGRDHLSAWGNNVGNDMKTIAKLMHLRPRETSGYHFLKLFSDYYRLSQMLDPTLHLADVTGGTTRLICYNHGYGWSRIAYPADNHAVRWFDKRWVSSSVIHYVQYHRHK